MRILIYEAMPDIVRADVIIRIARELEAQRHTVFFLLDEDVHLLKRNSIDRPHIVNCLNVIRSRFPRTGIPFFATPSNPSHNKNFLKNPSVQTLKEIEAYKSSHQKHILKQFQPDQIVIWNGLMDYQSGLINAAKGINPEQQFSFLEAGWFPQKETYYSDSQGVNAVSSISRTIPPPLNDEQKIEIKKWKEEYRGKHGNHRIRDKGYYFVPLQLESDTNITLFSPFKSMKVLLQWIVDNTDSDFPIIARPHPLSGSDQNELSNLNERLHLDKETPLQKLIAESHAVIGINSTVLLESLIYEKPTIALGEGIFQFSNAVYVHPIEAAIPSMLNTQINSTETQEAFLHFLRSHQHEIPSPANNKKNKAQRIEVETETETTRYSKAKQIISMLKIEIKGLITLLLPEYKSKN